MNYVENHEETSGTLIVSDGSHTANITLLGQYSADGFTVEADGTSGTLLSRSSDLNEGWNVLIGPDYAAPIGLSRRRLAELLFYGRKVFLRGSAERR